MLQYFQRDEMPGRQFFECERYRSTLTTEACAVQWRSVNHAGSERMFKCKACPIGALHAGETAANMSPIMGTLTCGRCGEGATRLISKHLCVSCYNRQREWLIGYNAKGKSPVKMIRLDKRVISYMTGSDPRVLKMDLASSTVELMWACLRDCKNTVRFAFRGTFSGQITQARLF